MNIKQKITSALVIGSMMAAVVAPASFAAVKVKGNGAGSVNGVANVKLNKKVVKQGNVTAAGTFVMTSTKTGWNSANGNTGGDTNVTSGNSTTTTKVTTTGGDNQNTSGESESCCCGGNEGDAVISGNGAGSINGILIVSACKDVVHQGNATLSQTTVISNSSTGGNSANGNTGGNTTIGTGDATTTTTVTTTGGSNTNN